MATETATAVPHSFVASFIVPDHKTGNVDMRKTLARFQESVEAYVKENAELKPTIMAELQQYELLGENRLIQFAMHALKLPATGESQERVKSAISELERAGKIVYKTSESGLRRGRGAGWQIAPSA